MLEWQRNFSNGKIVIEDLSVQILKHTVMLH